MKQLMEKIQQNKKAAMIGGGVLVVLLVILIAFAVSSGGSKFEKLIDLGNHYLEEMEYEEAIATFDSAIAIEPRDERGYIGKATAEYRLGWLDDAVETLTTGIEMVEDSTNIQAMLDEILAERDATASEEDAEENYAASSETERDVWLNYMEVRLYDAKEFQVQLEVVGDEGNESSYTWTSSSKEKAIVSTNGLVTVYSVEDEINARQDDYYYDGVTITVQDSSGKTDSCWIARYFEKGEESQNADYTIRKETENAESPITILIGNNGDTSSATLDGLDEYVYYSGDIVIPEQLTYQGSTYSITTIMEKAFTYSTELTSVTIPSSVTSIDGYESVNPFLFCSQLKTITVADENKSYQTVDGVLYSRDGKMLIAYPAQKEGETFELPKEVEQIVLGALSGCTNLKKITVEEGNEYFEAVDGVLIDSKTKTLLAYPGGKEDSYYESPDGVATVGSYAFYNVQAEEVHISSDVTTLNGNAFYECGKLITLSGMEQVANITNSGIVSCDNLNKIGGGEGTKQINFGRKNTIELINPAELVNLESLNLKVVDGNDLSWLLGMSSLHQLDLILNSLVETDLDLDVLYQMKGLTSLFISGTKSSLTEEQQEKIQEFIDSRTNWESVSIFGVSN